MVTSGICFGLRIGPGISAIIDIVRRYFGFEITYTKSDMKALLIILLIEALIVTLSIIFSVAVEAVVVVILGCWTIYLEQGLVIWAYESWGRHVF